MIPLEISHGVFLRNCQDILAVVVCFCCVMEGPDLRIERNFFFNDKYQLFKVITLFFIAIHRRLIPKYFCSLFEGGVSKVYFMVFDTKENYMNSTVTLDCKHASIITHHTKPTETKVRLGLK